MLVIKKETKEIEIVEDEICNKCSKSMKLEDGQIYGLSNAHVNGGYLSKKLVDTTMYGFSICESCLKEIFDSFEIPVTETDYNPFD
jgi:hypothetical protein